MTGWRFAVGQRFCVVMAHPVPQEIRMVDKKDKHGNQLAISFVEFETAMQANIALKALQVSPCAVFVTASNGMLSRPTCGF